MLTDALPQQTSPNHGCCFASTTIVVSECSRPISSASSFHSLTPATKLVAAARHRLYEFRLSLSPSAFLSSDTFCARLPLRQSCRAKAFAINSSLRRWPLSPPAPAQVECFRSERTISSSRRRRSSHRGGTGQIRTSALLAAHRPFQNSMRFL